MLSYWEKNSFITPNPDVAVIGSGIVGLSAAIELKRRMPSLQVTVLEKGPIPSGASTKNAGFACFGSISELIDDLAHGHSEDEVFALVDKRWRGLLRLREKLGDSAMGYEPLGGHEVFTNPIDFDRCVEQLDYFNHHLAAITGDPAVYQRQSLGAAQSFGFKDLKGIIINPLEGQIHTGKMMQALLALARQHGVEIVNGVGIRTIEEAEHGATLDTDAGFLLYPRRVLVCTNGFTKRLFPVLDVTPARNQVLVTAPIPGGVPFKGCFHYEMGYFYFRNIGRDRVLLGGGRHLDRENEMTDEQGTTPLIRETLEKLLTETILPNKKVTIEHWWSGTLGIGQIKKPIVEQISPHVAVSVRMGGMGVAIGTIVGEEGAALILETL